jgi:hypothetical protein
MKIKRITGAFILMILLILSCAKASKLSSSDKSGPSSYKKEVSENFSGYSNDEEKIKSEIKDNKQEAANKKENIETDRKIIKSGNIEYKVKELSGIERNIEDNVKKFGGYMSSLESYESSISAVVRIPAEKFDEFIRIANTFGSISSKNISAKDVTKEYFDLETRIENKKISIRRIREFLLAAKTVDDYLKVEDRLTRVTEDLEVMEGEIKNMSNLVSFSTLNLRFSLPYASPELDRKWPSIKKMFGDLWHFIVWFFTTIFFGILYVLVIATVVILILAFIYYLTFGRLGLVKRLFRTLSGKAVKK